MIIISLSLKMALACLKTFPLKVLFLLTLLQEAAPESTGFSLKLFPWDSPNSPFYHPNLTQTRKIQMMVISSNATALSRLPGNGTVYAKAIQIPVKNQALRYTVKIRIGSPATEVTLLLDTGSGPIWTQCQQSKYYFNPKKSRTYKALPCEHPVCQNGKKSCKCIKGTCVCRQSYGFAGGKIQHIDAVLSSDSFTLPVKNNGVRTFSNMIFGCSSRSPVFSGILGLDKLPVSLISQVRNEVQGRYSYCLHDGDSYLRFGNDIPRVRKDAKTTTILYPDQPTLFLDLKDISVDQKPLGLSPVLFSYEQGGFFVDTGAQFTVIKKQAYDKVIDAFANYYNVPQPGILCIGLIPGEVSILGALQQRNTRFVFDINANTLKGTQETGGLHLNPVTNLDEIEFRVQHQEKFRYSVDVKIGTPGNVVKLLLDTGSGFIWTQCSQTAYRPFSSETYKRWLATIVFALKDMQMYQKPVCLRHQIWIKWLQIYTKMFSRYVSLTWLWTIKAGYRFWLLKPATPQSLWGLGIGQNTDISIGGQRLGLSPSLFSLKNGGVFMDTGIQYTVLTRKAYDKVNRAFQRYFKGKLKKIDGIHQNLQPCYKLTPGFNDYPTMTFHFDGADYEAEYTHIKDESSRITCTAVLPGKRTIIGALQQWNTRFMFDINKNLLKFYRDDCAG
ncbi:UNVERIFIED_CONTAM: Aspartic proteinase CDR1 [Sesamum angustifolium]|uniref:Aspartic proteinase CDR1 n=1 Tax=Sesamum angustifolium TaxID=2727405 RepID=A0AAW2KWG0_9LAMI